MIKRMNVGIAISGVLLLAAGVQADTIPLDGPWISDNNTGASLSGSVSYNSGTAQLTITITNTSGALGGALTGFGFNINSADATASAALNSYSFDGDADGLNWAKDGTLPPPTNVGNFSQIFTVDGTDITGAGDGTTGIEVGETYTFVFDITATDAGSLTAASFLDLDSNTKGYGFVARFKGVGPNGDSDWVVLVPLPPAVWMGIIGFVGVVVGRKQLLAIF